MEMLKSNSTDLGKRGDDAERLISPARWMECASAGKHAPSSSYCWKISTWNVRSLYQAGKLANVTKEMIRMDIDVLGVSETFWKNTGYFRYNLPFEEEFRVIFAGGNDHRKGVAFIMRGIAKDSVMNYNLKSERMIIVRVSAEPKNLLLCQVYAPTTADSDEEIENFYEEVENAINEIKKWDDIILLMGDFNAKIGKGKQDEVVGPHGLGKRNDRGERLVEFCIKHKLVICNTWFEQRENAKHTWSAPDGRTKNQIDYIMINKRYRNSIKNAKARPGADCGSDHNPIVIDIKTKLKRVKKSKSTRKKWNVSNLDQEVIKERYKQESERLIYTAHHGESVEKIWKNLKEGLIKTANAVCGKSTKTGKQNWITVEILNKMEERRMWKRNEEKTGAYLKL